MTEIQLLATKMVLSNTENQIRLILFGCVSGTDSIVFVSNDSKRKYSSEILKVVQCNLLDSIMQNKVWRQYFEVKLSGLIAQSK